MINLYFYFNGQNKKPEIHDHRFLMLIFMEIFYYLGALIRFCSGLISLASPSIMLSSC